MTAGRRGYAYRVIVAELPDDWTGRTPAPRRYLSRAAANRRRDKLDELGCVAYVQRSDPVTWPDARRKRAAPARVVETIPFDPLAPEPYAV